MFQLKTTDTKTNAATTTGRQSKMSSNFLATVAGIAVGVPLAVAAMVPVLHSELSGSTTQAIQATPASAVLSCVQPATTPATTVAAVVTPSIKPVTGGAIVPPTPTPTNANPSWQSIGNLYTNDTATIGNTGPDSTNKATFTTTNTTTATNTNDLNVTNTNTQMATSGNATTTNNTTAGSATSGATSNSDSRDTSINIQN